MAAAWMNLGIVKNGLQKLEVKVQCHTFIGDCLQVCYPILQESQMCYLEAIQQRPKYPDAYYNLGNLVSSSNLHMLVIALPDCSSVFPW